MLKMKKFNICEKCGVPLKIVKTVRLEERRIRTYVCPKCKRIKKSLELFYPEPNANQSHFN